MIGIPALWSRPTDNHAIFLFDQGEEGEAKRLCQEAVDASKEVLGAVHPVTKARMNNPWGIR